LEERREDACEVNADGWKCEKTMTRKREKERVSNGSYARGTRAKSLSTGSLIEARDDALSATFALIFPLVYRLPPSLCRERWHGKGEPLLILFDDVYRRRRWRKDEIAVNRSEANYTLLVLITTSSSMNNC